MTQIAKKPENVADLLRQIQDERDVLLNALTELVEVIHVHTRPQLADAARLYKKEHYPVSGYAEFWASFAMSQYQSGKLMLAWGGAKTLLRKINGEKQ